MEITPSSKVRLQAKRTTLSVKSKKRPTAKRKVAAKLNDSVTASFATAEMIATAAYFRAEHRGFEPGHELEDWLAAEKEISA